MQRAASRTALASAAEHSFYNFDMGDPALTSQSSNPNHQDQLFGMSGIFNTGGPYSQGTPPATGPNPFAPAAQMQWNTLDLGSPALPYQSPNSIQHQSSGTRNLPAAPNARAASPFHLAPAANLPPHVPNVESAAASTRHPRAYHHDTHIAQAGPSRQPSHGRSTDLADTQSFRNHLEQKATDFFNLSQFSAPEVQYVRS